jgi:hypothetical protein
MTKKAVKTKNLQALKSLTLPLEMLKQALLQWYNKRNSAPSSDF